MLDMACRRIEKVGLAEVRNGYLLVVRKLTMRSIMNRFFRLSLS
jgi:hypothetical protein